MNIVCGLGNPGKNYLYNRHNVGFLFVDYVQKKRLLPEFKLQKKFQAEITEGKNLTLFKPQTFMNKSGEAVQSYVQYFDKHWQTNTSTIFVAFDDLDLAFGSHKIQLGKGPKIHNGLLSLYSVLGTQEFWHIRIGVDNRQGLRSIPGSEYVLANFSQTELDQLQNVFADIESQLQAKF